MTWNFVTALAGAPSLFFLSMKMVLSNLAPEFFFSMLGVNLWGVKEKKGGSGIQ